MNPGPPLNRDGLQDLGSVFRSRWRQFSSEGRVALVDRGGREVTYQELLEKCTGDPTLGESSAAGLIFEASLEAVISYLQLLFRPGFVALLSDGLGVGELIKVVDLLQLRQLIGPARALEKMPLKEMERLGHWIWGTTEVEADRPVDDQTTVLLGTSGTTGNPKFVRLDSRSLAVNAADISLRLQLHSEDVSLTVLPPFYSYGLSVINSVLVAGGTLAVGKFDLLSHSFRFSLDRFGVTHLPGVPSSYGFYEKLGLISEPPKSLRTYTQAGGRLGPETVRRYALELGASGRKFFPMYGQTEASARMSILDSGLAAENPDSVGEAVPSGRISIGSKNAENEVVFEGPNVMLGYFGDIGYQDPMSIDTQHSDLATGDLGFTRDGLLFITGRLKRIAKIAGVRLDLDQIETMLTDVLHEVAVVDIEDAVLVALPSTSDVSATLVHRSLAEMGLNKRQYKIVPVDALPLTPSGKKDYQKLRESI